MRIISKLTSVVLAATAFLAASCDNRDQFVLNPAGITDNVVEVAEKEGLTVFAAALKGAGMDSTFDYLGQFTLFAPTNEAFAAAGINPGNVGSISRATLQSVLRQHILPGRTGSLSLLPGPNASYNNINRDFLYCTNYVSGPLTGFFFNGASVTKPDIQANNGVLHVINQVFATPSGNSLTSFLASRPNLSFLAAAIQRAGLTNALNTRTSAVTLLAPTNAAFQAAGFADTAAINAADPATLATILTMHVIPNTSAATTNGRLFSVDFRNGNLVTLNAAAPVTVALNGTAPTFKGNGNPAVANVSAANFLYRSAIPGGQPNVLHIIDRVLLP